MSSEAQQCIVDIDDQKSPRQNNGAILDSIASIQLPDLTNILAALNKKKEDGLDSQQHESDETRAFGNSISQYSHLQEDGSIAKPLAKRERKPRGLKEPKSIVLKEKKTRAVKAPKDPAAKAVKKKPLTITERAVAPFLVPETSKPNGLVDQSILDFLAPAAAPAALGKAAGKKRAAPRKVKAKAEPVPVLSTPRTARRKHVCQTLTYSINQVSDLSDSHVLNPSKLISLSKGLFFEGNRGLSDELTDGGPDKCISNQDAARMDEDRFFDLTMLPSRNPQNEEVVEPVQNVNPFEDNDGQLGQSSLFQDHDQAGLEQYLEDLVSPSDDERAGLAFPVTPIEMPKNRRADTVESLRELLDSGHFGREETPDDIINITSSSPGPRTKRTRSPESPLKRNVSPRTIDQLTPEQDPSILLVTSSAEARGRPDHLQGITHQTKTAHERNGAANTSQKCHGNVIPAMFDSHLPIIDCSHGEDLGDQPTELIIELDSKQDSGRNGTKRGEISSKSEPSREDFASLDKMRSKEEVDYWVVPDSEDESVATNAQSTTAKGSERPTFEGYTTARLQTEISRFGFKVSKNRAGMIDLLDKCWSAKNSSAATNDVGDLQVIDIAKSLEQEALKDNSVVSSSVQLATTASSLAPPTKARQKRETADEKASRLELEKAAKNLLKKQKAEEKAAKDLLKKKQAEEIAAKKQQSKIASKEAARLASLQATKDLHSTLTRLLREDNEDHSWWQKILSYEPIVLEDLTDWLGEVHGIQADPDSVRDYFDRKGVCCVRRITRQGKGRRRF